MQSNSKFCYTKPETCSKSCTDSLKYCAKDKDGKTDYATITIKVKCTDCSKCSDCSKCRDCPQCDCSRCFPSVQRALRAQSASVALPTATKHI